MLADTSSVVYPIILLQQKVLPQMNGDTLSNNPLKFRTPMVPTKAISHDVFLWVWRGTPLGDSHLESAKLDFLVPRR